MIRIRVKSNPILIFIPRSHSARHHRARDAGAPGPSEHGLAGVEGNGVLVEQTLRAPRPGRPEHPGLREQGLQDCRLRHGQVSLVFRRLQHLVDFRGH